MRLPPDAASTTWPVSCRGRRAWPWSVSLSAATTAGAALGLRPDRRIDQSECACHRAAAASERESASRLPRRCSCRSVSRGSPGTAWRASPSPACRAPRRACDTFTPTSGDSVLSINSRTGASNTSARPDRRAAAPSQRWFASCTTPRSGSESSPAIQPGKSRSPSTASPPRGARSESWITNTRVPGHSRAASPRRARAAASRSPSPSRARCTSFERSSSRDHDAPGDELRGPRSRPGTWSRSTAPPR